MKELPVVEAGTFAQGEAGQEVAAVQRGRLDYRCNTGRTTLARGVAVSIGRCQPMTESLYIDCHAWPGSKRDRVAADRQPLVFPETLSERGKSATQAGAATVFV